jgi:hypothetical protein
LTPLVVDVDVGEGTQSSAVSSDCRFDGDRRLNRAAFGVRMSSISDFIEFDDASEGPAIAATVVSVPKLVRHLIVLAAAALGFVVGAILGLLLAALILGHGANVGEGAVIVLVPVCLMAGLVSSVGVGFLARALTRGRALDVSTKPSATSA